MASYSAQLMDPLIQEKMRARTALLEIERQKVKVLITTEAARKLREHARATCADLAIITAQIGALGRHETEGA